MMFAWGASPSNNYLPMAAIAIDTVTNPVRDENLYVEPVIAWRCWQVSDEKGLLRSWTKNVIWRPHTELEADCLSNMKSLPFGAKPPPGDHLPPSVHGCGIYGVNSLEGAFQWLAQSGTGIIGVVKLWGRVIVCQDGYIAQFAYPAALLDGGKDVKNGVIEALADRYGVGLEWAS